MAPPQLANHYKLVGTRQADSTAYRLLPMSTPSALLLLFALLCTASMVAYVTYVIIRAAYRYYFTRNIMAFPIPCGDENCQHIECANFIELGQQYIDGPSAFAPVDHPVFPEDVDTTANSVFENETAMSVGETNGNGECLKKDTESIFTIASHYTTDSNDSKDDDSGIATAHVTRATSISSVSTGLDIAGTRVPWPTPYNSPASSSIMQSLPPSPQLYANFKELDTFDTMSVLELPPPAYFELEDEEEISLD